MGALNYQQLQNVNKATQQATTTQNQNNMPLDAILNAGLQVGGTIARQRQASGKSAARQARIAACGRKPLIGFGKKFRQRKADYEKCAANAQSASDAANAPLPPFDNRSGDTGDGGNKTMLYVGIGLGVVVLGVVGFILYKKFGK